MWAGLCDGLYGVVTAMWCRVVCYVALCTVLVAAVLGLPHVSLLPIYDRVGQRARAAQCSGLHAACGGVSKSHLQINN